MHSDGVILVTIAHRKKASISEMHSVEYSIPYKLLYLQKNYLSPQWLRYLTSTLNFVTYAD
jgi:hypothetical protein